MEWCNRQLLCSSIISYNDNSITHRHYTDISPLLNRDGFVEEAVSGQDLIKLYACTPQSLGSCSELDVAMAEDLLKLGKIAGELVDAQRCVLY